MSDATFYDRMNTIYQFIKPFLDKKKKMFIFEEYGAFKSTFCFWENEAKKRNSSKKRKNHIPDLDYLNLRSKSMKRAASSEKVPWSICKLCRFVSSCVCAKYHPGLSSPFKHSIVSNDSVS